MHQVIILAGSISDQTILGSTVVDVVDAVDAEVGGLIVVVVVGVPSVVVVDAEVVDVTMVVVDFLSSFWAVVAVSFCFSPSL